MHAGLWGIVEAMGNSQGTEAPTRMTRSRSAECSARSLLARSASSSKRVMLALDASFIECSRSASASAFRAIAESCLWWRRFSLAAARSLLYTPTKDT